MTYDDLISNPQPLTNDQKLALCLVVLRDAYESLRRLPSVDGAFRVSNMAQIAAAIQKVQE